MALQRGPTLLGPQRSLRRIFQTPRLLDHEGDQLALASDVPVQGHLGDTDRGGFEPPRPNGDLDWKRKGS
jgi:hypothetical protein